MTAVDKEKELSGLKGDLTQTKLDLTLMLFLTAIGFIAILFIIPSFYDVVHDRFLTPTVIIIHIAVIAATVFAGFASYIFGSRYIQYKSKLPPQYHGDDRIER